MNRLTYNLLTVLALIVWVTAFYYVGFFALFLVPVLFIGLGGLFELVS